MTALERYVRLEATGVWREAADARPREVIVAFGNATLILRDLDERPLAHWALAGLRVAGTRGGATVYATTEDAAETLAIRDPDMVEAIAAVAAPAAAAVAQPPGRWRAGRLVALALLAGALLLAARHGPEALRAQAVRMMPPEQAEEFGDQMLLTLMETGSALCDRPSGQLALARLAADLSDGPAPRVRVLDLGATQTAALPGRTVLLNRATLADAAAPEEAAGWILVALGREPLQALLEAAGPLGVTRYVVSGKLGAAALERAAAAARRPPSPAEGAAALAALAGRGIDPSAFAEALRRAGLLAGPVPDAPAAPRGPLLDDEDWTAARRVCG